jgi:hypothetical protein
VQGSADVPPGTTGWLSFPLTSEVKPFARLRDFKSGFWENYDPAESATP